MFRLVDLTTNEVMTAHRTFISLTKNSGKIFQAAHHCRASARNSFECSERKHQNHILVIQELAFHVIGEQPL